MRTLHIDTERTWRGGEQQAFSLMTGLIRSGHFAEAVCRRDGEFCRSLRDADINALEIKPHGEYDLLAAARIARFMLARRHEIIHAHTSHGHALAQLARLVAAPFTNRLPPLVVSRRVDFSAHRLPFNLNLLKYRFGTARFIAVSTRVRDVLVDDGVPRELISIVPSSADLRRFEGVSVGGLREEFAISPSAKIIVNVGSLVGHKSQVDLVRAMRFVSERVPEAICIIVGEGPQRGRIESEIRQLDLSKHVILAGFRRDAIRFTKLCDVFAISSEMEGLCSCILEAFALSRPVVSTSGGGIPDIVTNGVNGILVPTRDPEALARGIIRLLEDPSLAQQYAAEGRRTVENKFTAERMVASTLAVYREVLRQPP